MTGRALIGCSGWSYREWPGPVYPTDLASSRWFEWYARNFDTVELNATHYRRPSAAAVARWAAQAPEGFVYAVKVHRFGTHWKQLTDAGEWMPGVVDPMLPLGDHLGPFLLQIPPGHTPQAGRLDEALRVAAERLPGSRWAIEFRDPRWFADEALAVLERHGAALVIHDLLLDHPWVETAPWRYVRCHGPHAEQHPYAEAYPETTLRRLADRLGGDLAAGRDVHVYFNNDRGGHAFHDARRLRAMVLEGTGHR